MTRILVAEDRPDIRRSLGQMLADYGYDVVVAKSAAEALTVLDSEAVPELVLLDRNMPELERLGPVRQPCERPDVIATYLLMRPTRKQTPLEVHLLHSRTGDDPTGQAEAGGDGLRVEIGKALVGSHRQRGWLEGTGFPPYQRTKR
jgi:CheY-like chemotaxis protein